MNFLLCRSSYFLKKNPSQTNEESNICPLDRNKPLQIFFCISHFTCSCTPTLCIPSHPHSSYNQFRATITAPQLLPSPSAGSVLSGCCPAQIRGMSCCSSPAGQMQDQINPWVVTAPMQDHLRNKLCINMQLGWICS